MFASYVNGGGRLVAMRPSALLNGLLGITSHPPGTTANGYLEVVQSGPGAGLNAATLPIKGMATNYALAGGASVVGRLFSDNDSVTAFPAVHRFNNTATWSFDLARSVAFVRQGDPANHRSSGMADRKSARPATLLRARLTRLGWAIPHADVQMRLFARVIESLLEGNMPLPRLWYFPGTSRTLMVVTADTHTTNVSSHDLLLDLVESVGGRASLYLGRWVGPPLRTRCRAGPPPATRSGCIPFSSTTASPTTSTPATGDPRSGSSRRWAFPTARPFGTTAWSGSAG